MGMFLVKWDKCKDAWDALAEGTQSTIPFVCAAIGIGIWDAERMDQVVARVLMYEKLHGAFRQQTVERNLVVPLYFTRDELLPLVGLDVNVSYEPDIQWLARTYKYVAIDLKCPGAILYHDTPDEAIQADEQWREPRHHQAHKGYHPIPMIVMNPKPESCVMSFVAYRQVEDREAMAWVAVTKMRRFRAATMEEVEYIQTLVGQQS